MYYLAHYEIKIRDITLINLIIICLINVFVIVY
jgi:hypothetical protein